MRRQRRIPFPGWAPVLIFSILVSGPGRAEEPVELESLLKIAQEANPAIQAAALHAAAFETIIPAAGAWDDPRLSFNIINVPWKTLDFAQAPMTGKQIQLMQRIPLPGITGLRTERARQSATLADFSHAELRNMVRQQVQIAYYNLYYCDKAIAITGKNKALLRDFITIAESKYATGQGIQQDVLKAQVSLSKVLERLIILDQNRVTLTARINTLLDRDAQTPIGLPADVDERLFPYTIETLEAMGRAHRPLLQGAEVAIARSGTDHALARKMYWPSLDVSVNYSQRDNRHDFISAMFSVEIPLFGSRKQDRYVEQTRLNMQSAEAGYRALQNDVRYAIADLSSRIGQHRERMILLRTGIIPQGSQSLQSAISGYRVDAVDFLTLLDSQSTLFQDEITYYEILAAYRIAIANLEWVVGRPLPETLQGQEG